MLTLIARAISPDAAPLVETLTPLVDGVVKGLIGRSIIVAVGEARQSESIRTVAGEAGADYFEAPDWGSGLGAAIIASKTAMLCVVDAGVIAHADFIPALDRFLRMTSGSGRIAATRTRISLAALLNAKLARVDEDQIIVLSCKEAGHGIWNRSYGRRLTLLDAMTTRLR